MSRIKIIIFISVNSFLTSKSIRGCIFVVPTEQKKLLLLKPVIQIVDGAFRQVFGKLAVFGLCCLLDCNVKLTVYFMASFHML